MKTEIRRSPELYQGIAEEYRFVKVCIAKLQKCQRIVLILDTISGLQESVSKNISRKLARFASCSRE